MPFCDIAYCETLYQKSPLSADIVVLNDFWTDSVILHLNCQERVFSITPTHRIEILTHHVMHDLAYFWALLELTKIILTKLTILFRSQILCFLFVQKSNILVFTTGNRCVGKKRMARYLVLLIFEEGAFFLEPPFAAPPPV